MTRNIRRTQTGGVVVSEPPLETVRVWPTWWTLEHYAYGLLLFAALFVRFLWLGARPLSRLEAHLSWLAWHNVQPLPHMLVQAVSPLAYSVQWVWFLVTGGSDALARFWPALVGAVIVVFPYFLREQIGRERALLAALLLAFSTHGVYWSRHASGVMFAVVTSLGLVLAVLAWISVLANKPHAQPLSADELFLLRRRLNLVFVMLALTLLSDAAVYTALVGIIVGLWPLRDTIVRAWHDVGSQARHRGVGVFLLTFLLAGSAFLTDVFVLGNAGDLLGQWVMSFWRGAGYPWYWVVFRLIADEPLLVVLGIWGAWRAWRSSSVWKRLWLWWFVVGLVFSFRPGRTSADVALLVVPLVFLAADTLWDVLRLLREPSSTWREEGVLAGAFFVILVFWSMMVAGYLYSGEDRYIPALIVIPFLFAALLGLYSFWLGKKATLRVGLFALLITLVVWSWMAMWVQNLHVDRAAALDVFPGIERSVTYWDVRLMVDTLERISAEKVTDWHEVAVDAVLTPQDDVLRWYLREFKHLREVPSVKSITSPVAITHPGIAELSGYTGMDWVVEIQGLPTDLDGSFYHWWLYREAKSLPQEERVILWVTSEQ